MSLPELLPDLAVPGQQVGDLVGGEVVGAELHGPEGENVNLSIRLFIIRLLLDSLHDPSLQQVLEHLPLAPLTVHMKQVYSGAPSCLRVTHDLPFVNIFTH